MRVFADALYWVAITNRRDQWYLRAVRAKESVAREQLVTTDAVLAEFLAALASGGEHMRTPAARTVRAALANTNVEVIPLDRDLFLDALALFEARPDKEYSLVDCASMVIMRARGITRLLTNDHHFEQEGFTALIKR